MLACRVVGVVTKSEDFNLVAVFEFCWFSCNIGAAMVGIVVKSHAISYVLSMCSCLVVFPEYFVNWNSSRWLIPVRSDQILGGFDICFLAGVRCSWGIREHVFRCRYNFSVCLAVWLICCSFCVHGDHREVPVFSNRLNWYNLILMLRQILEQVGSNMTVLLLWFRKFSFMQIRGGKL